MNRGRMAIAWIVLGVCGFYLVGILLLHVRAAWIGGDAAAFSAAADKILEVLKESVVPIVTLVAGYYLARAENEGS